MQVNKLENLATGKAVDALLNYETVVQVCRTCRFQLSLICVLSDQ